ncbi:MAG: integrase core domain-containing protein [Hymenobacter sp.]
MAQITRWKLQLRQQAAQVFAEAPAVAAARPRRGALVRGHRPAANGKRAAKKTLRAMSRSPATRPGAGQRAPGSRCRPAARPWAWRAAASTTSPAAKVPQNLLLMRLLDEEFTRHNFKGVLGLRDHLRLAGHAVNEKRVRRLVRLMGHEPVYPKPRLSVPGAGRHALSVPAARPPGYGPQRGLEHRHHLRAHGQGLPLPGRRARLALRVTCSAGSSPTRSTWAFACRPWPRPCARPPAPHIFNSDQGSQFTSQAYEQALLAAGCRISRDGRGRATDNAFIERLWRTVKWEHVYLNPADDGHHLHQQLHAYFAYYNHHRPHQSLHGQTPAQVFAQTPTFNHNHIYLTSPAKLSSFWGVVQASAATDWNSACCRRTKREAAVAKCQRRGPVHRVQGAWYARP